MPTTQKDIVLIAAAEFEITSVRSILQNQGARVHFFCCGIGAMDAIANTTSWICQEKFKNILNTCDSIIFIGTCGIFADFSKPENFTVEKCSWLPVDERLNLSYRVPGTLPSIELQPRFKLPKAHVLSSQNISLTAECKREHAITLENLELYSITKVLTDYLAKFQVILTTTNAVGINAHSSWKAHFKLAGEVAAVWFKENAVC